VTFFAPCNFFTGPRVGPAVLPFPCFRVCRDSPPTSPPSFPKHARDDRGCRLSFVQGSWAEVSPTAPLSRTPAKFAGFFLFFYLRLTPPHFPSADCPTPKRFSPRVTTSKDVTLRLFFFFLPPEKPLAAFFCVTNTVESFVFSRSCCDFSVATSPRPMECPPFFKVNPRILPSYSSPKYFPSV